MANHRKTITQETMPLQSSDVLVTTSGENVIVQCPDHLVETLTSPDTDPAVKNLIWKGLLSQSAGEGGSEGMDANINCSQDDDDYTEDNTSSSLPGQQKWKDTESKMLIDLRIKMDDEFRGSKTHKALWNKLADTMNKNGMFVTGEKCSNKWKSIKRDYKTVVDKNAKSGSGKQKKCKFFDELNNLFGNKPSTRPECVVDTSSFKSFTKSKARTDSSTEDATVPNCPPNTTASDTDEDSDSQAVQIRKRKILHGKMTASKVKKSGTDRLIDWLDNYKSVQQDMQEKQLKFQKEQDEEKFRRMDRFLELMSKQTGKKDEN
ncbi:uncharacterized protein LOC134238512 isoform X2 [Saccostrea cucullata]|uniref:uncharacterized protein LOC134238512 isoform X2 n=1 Tax=Saccostrea cuccullata TaxID=36930 RepID=UPI002ED45BBD